MVQTETNSNGLLTGVGIEPRAYQRRIVDRVVAMLTGPFTDDRNQRREEVGSVLIESPTGSGKTIMGLAVARALQQQCGYTVAWVAMRKNLLAQVSRENTGKGFDVELKTVSMFSRKPPQADLLVCDECQHDATPSGAAIHSAVRPTKVLGLSATPWRSDRASLMFETNVRDAGIHNLIQDGFLSPYRHYTIPAYSPAAIAKLYASDPDRWGKSLVFFLREVDCEECRRRLAACGIRAETVSGHSDRERQLDWFAHGRLDVLLSMGVLTEGFDCPELRTVFIRPAGSRGCVIQMAGRVLRRHADSPLKQVVQCCDTRYPFTRTATAAEQYVWAEGAWRTLTINRHLDKICCRSLQQLAGTTVTLPAMLVERQRRPGWTNRSHHFDEV